MSGLGFAVTVGRQSARWPAADGTLELLELECCTGVGGGWARLRLGPPQGEAPTAGDRVTIHLDDGGGERPVFTGELDHVGATPTAWQLRAHDGLPRLARLELERVWTDTTADAVLRDLLTAARLTVGNICPGPALRCFHALRGPRGLRLAEALLARMGAELIIAADGKAHVLTPTPAAAQHTLTWGVDLLDLDLTRRPPTRAGVIVHGEGARDTLGASKAHWLPRDTTNLVGRAHIDPDGAVTPGDAATTGLTIVDGALDTAAACKAVATATANLLAARPLRGSLLTLGRPAIAPGQWLALAGLPKDHALARVLADQPLRARRVTHRFDASSGFTTRVEL